MYRVLDRHGRFLHFHLLRVRFNRVRFSVLPGVRSIYAEGERQMKECASCKYAQFGCYDYYGTTAKNWFVDGCKLDRPVPETGACEDYDEYIPQD